MQRVFATALLASALGAVPSHGQVLYPDYSGQRPVRLSAAQPPAGGGLGGGFIEAVFGGGLFQPRAARPARSYPAQPQYDYEIAHYGRPGLMPGERSDADRALNPIYRRQVVDYDGNEQPGTIIIDTPKRFLYLVQEDGKAVRYGIGVGRPGFTWAGVKHITNKREWPDWRPPDEMLKRRPDLPRYMAGGPDNPLGARAMYLGSSLYRIHGSNEPWTIGTAVSSGCIRMRNEDVIDLYERVKVGTKVVVI
jgi:lipoprotein-anchoring transpeptidase ErfK/SrfK